MTKTSDATAHSGKAEKAAPLWIQIMCILFSYNDTAVVDNVYPFLQTIFCHHVPFIPNLKKYSHMDTLTGYRRLRITFSFTSCHSGYQLKESISRSSITCYCYSSGNGLIFSTVSRRATSMFCFDAWKLEYLFRNFAQQFPWK